MNPTKISGQCGRLMCCLKYEQDYYEETLKKLPRVGKDIMTPDGVGVVTEINVLRERVKVRVKTGDDTFEVREYELPDVRKLAPGEKALYQETASKAPEAPYKQNEAKEDEEPKEEKVVKRYPRPKIVKTMNTDQYMEKYSESQGDKDKTEQTGKRNFKKSEKNAEENGEEGKDEHAERKMRPRHRHQRGNKSSKPKDGE